ncbi:unnamed protein product [Linum trigynum]|uniref:Uncharacterized protein n=1 Tax=Linum trigynum TaxID=586398 RepID=A0AAV2FRT1_9ROSI
MRLSGRMRTLLMELEGYATDGTLLDPLLHVGGEAGDLVAEALGPIFADDERGRRREFTLTVDFSPPVGRVKRKLLLGRSQDI